MQWELPTAFEGGVTVPDQWESGPSTPCGTTFLGQEDQQDDESDNGHQDDQLPPATAVGVMQASGGRSDGGNKGSKHEDAVSCWCNSAQDRTAYSDGESEPPIFRPRRTTIEFSVFDEARFYRVSEVHCLSPFFRFNLIRSKTDKSHPHNKFEVALLDDLQTT